jgi:hypothetical protein
VSEHAELNNSQRQSNDFGKLKHQFCHAYPVSEHAELNNSTTTPQ